MELPCWSEFSDHPDERHPGSCFPMYSSGCNWGVVGKPKFDSNGLTELKRGCQPHCFSTLNHNLAYCYDAGRAFRWMLKQALSGFQGTTGSFDE